MDLPTREPSPENRDRHWMLHALELAARGEGSVEPNPMVGCVIVANDQIIGSGHHEQFGKPHAEPNAIQDVHRRGNHAQLTEATAYVTLEPCCHHGKTPPCTQAIAAAGIPRVVVAMQDPFGKVAGGGISALRSAGIEVVVGIEKANSQKLNLPYLKRVSQALPWVIAKWAMSLDGKIATHSGDSQWISSPTSRNWVHALRGRVDAILVGSQTAIVDNPMLTARGDRPSKRQALRVVFDSSLSTPSTHQLLQTAAIHPTLFWASTATASNRIEAFRQLGARVELSGGTDHPARLKELLQFLVAEYSATNLLIEGGGGLLGGLLQVQQIDQCEVFVAPKLIGGKSAPGPIAGLGLDALAQSPEIVDYCYEMSGPDIHVSCRLDWSVRSQQ